MSKFHSVINVRVTQKELDRAQSIVDSATFDGIADKYESLSHFLRCAMNALCNEEEQAGKENSALSPVDVLAQNWQEKKEKKLEVEYD